MHYPWVISSLPVSHILSTREDMHYPWGKFHSFFIHINFLTGTAYFHGYWGYDSRVLRIWLTGTAYPHRYWGYDSQVLMILLTGNAYPHGYWGYDSRVLHTLTGTAYSLYRVCSWDIKRLWEYLSLKFWLFFTRYACATKSEKQLVQVLVPYL